MSDQPEALRRPELTDPRAERVRRTASLARRAGRVRSGRFLVEGPGPVAELLAAAAADDRAGDAAGPALCRPRVEVVYATPAAAEALSAAADRAGAPLRTASAEVVAAMADTVTPQGVVAVARAVDVTLDELLSTGPGTLAVLARARDPGNAGTVVRAVDASGADGVVLTAGSVDVHAPKTVRSTAGSLFHVPVVSGTPVASAVATCQDAGLTVLAAAAGAAIDLDDLLDAADRGAGPLVRPHAWLLGNEAWGLPVGDRELADQVVAVPLHGRAESLNLAMAATVCLYASARARRSASR